MKNHLLKFVITGVALWVAIWIVPGFDFEGSFWEFAGVTLIVYAANAVVKPILNFFSIPFIVITFGLFLLVTNALILQLSLWLAGDVFDIAFTSTGFFWATFLGALVMSITHVILDAVFD